VQSVACDAGRTAAQQTRCDPLQERVNPVDRNFGHDNKTPAEWPGFFTETLRILTNNARNTNVGRKACDYSCPYLRSTARHWLPMRQLWAASVAPQRNRLVQVMPPVRSHIRAAAGLHGASSAKSMAFAVEPESATNGPINRHAKSTGFILKIPRRFLGRVLNKRFMTGMPALLCDAQSGINLLVRRKN
jgi:hypothetical protein